MMKTVYVVIINYNGLKDTINCLESVFRSDYQDLRVVLVDNDSRDGSLDAVRRWAAGEYRDTGDVPAAVRRLVEPPVRKPMAFVEYSCDRAESGGDGGTDARLVLVQAGSNLGFSEGNNVGIRYALARQADYFFVFNNDALCAPDAVSRLVQCAEETGAAIVGAVVLDREGKKVLFSGRTWPAHLFGRGRMPLGEPMPEHWQSGDVEGSAMLLRRDLVVQSLKARGYVFDPAMFLYCEDTDLCLYGRSLGHRCLVAKAAAVYHGLAQSTGGGGSPTAYYYLTRNRIILARRWLRGWWYVLFSLYYLPSRLLKQAVCFPLCGPRVLFAVLSGLADGYRGVTGRRHAGAGAP